VSLTAQLLAFSRKQRLEPQEVDLNSKIVGMSDLLSATLGETVQLQTALAADLWPALGQGTSMKVFLPRAEVALRDRERESEDAEQGPKVTVSILVVDDDTAVLRTTLRMLNPLGYAAVTAASGREALRLIASGREVDLVLADFAMPEMTGVELAKAIHATYPGLPVIVVTGYGNREELKDFGEARILQKPYTEGELMERITEALN
jgi:CheY-like chemotaxis protein